MGTVDRVSLSAQVREHVMATPHLALMSQRRNIYWRHDDTFTWPGAGLGENSAVVIDHLTAAGPGVGG